MEVTSQLHDLNSIAGSKTTTDTIQITKAIRTIAELLAPFVRCVLAGKHGRILQIIRKIAEETGIPKSSVQRWVHEGHVP